MVDPETPEQWQVAVDWAELLLMVDSARQFGLIKGGPRVNISRCESILKLGANRGITPRNLTDEELCRYLKQLL